MNNLSATWLGSDVRGGGLPDTDKEVGLRAWVLALVSMEKYTGLRSIRDLHIIVAVIGEVIKWKSCHSSALFG